MNNTQTPLSHSTALEHNKHTGGDDESPEIRKRLYYYLNDTEQCSFGCISGGQSAVTSVLVG